MHHITAHNKYSKNFEVPGLCATFKQYDQMHCRANWKYQCHFLIAMLPPAEYRLNGYVDGSGKSAHESIW